MKILSQGIHSFEILFLTRIYLNLNESVERILQIQATMMMLTISRMLCWKHLTSTRHNGDADDFLHVVLKKHLTNSKHNADDDDLF